MPRKRKRDGQSHVPDLSQRDYDPPAELMNNGTREEFEQWVLTGKINGVTPPPASPKPTRLAAKARQRAKQP